MWKLHGLDGTRLGECISDDVVPETLNLTDKLATPGDDYYNNADWATIQVYACSLKANVTRVKHKLGTTYVLICHLQSHASVSHSWCHCRLTISNFAIIDLISPEKLRPGHMAKYVFGSTSSRRRLRKRQGQLTPVTCKACTTSWSAPMVPRHHPLLLPTTWRPFVPACAVFSLT